VNNRIKITANEVMRSVTPTVKREGVSAVS
jgi:hypothetical protein